MEPVIPGEHEVKYTEEAQGIESLGFLIR